MNQYLEENEGVQALIISICGAELTAEEKEKYGSDRRRYLSPEESFAYVRGEQPLQELGKVKKIPC